MNESQHDTANDFGDAEGELERELQAMTPRDLSPAIRQKIAEGLVAPSPRRKPSAIVPIAIAIAASVLLLIGWFALRLGDDTNGNIANQPDKKRSGDTEAVRPNDGSAEFVAVGDGSVPTFWNYRAAADISFDELDQMLAQHGRGSMGGDTPLALDEL